MILLYLEEKRRKPSSHPNFPSFLVLRSASRQNLERQVKAVQFRSGSRIAREVSAMLLDQLLHPSRYALVVAGKATALASCHSLHYFSQVRPTLLRGGTKRVRIHIPFRHHERGTVCSFLHHTVNVSTLAHFHELGFFSTFDCVPPAEKLLFRTFLPISCQMRR